MTDQLTRKAIWESRVPPILDYDDFFLDYWIEFVQNNFSCFNCYCFQVPLYLLAYTWLEGSFDAQNDNNKLF